jgi:hypothetical protein
VSAQLGLLGSPDARRSGFGGHESRDSDSEVWLTPPHILSALGTFDLDPCACMLPRPWPTAREHYTREDNGLAKPWVGRVWLNPPYGGPSVIGPWLRRMRDHGRGTVLIFARTETAAFHEAVWPTATAMLFLRGRLRFHRPDGTRPDAPAGAPSVLVSYGEADAEVLAASGLDGAFVRLRAAP